jgi:hypothetical protein
MDTGDVVLATGALGTAAFGIVEALKWTSLGETGFGTALAMLGPLRTTLQVACGPEYETLLRGQYRGERAELVRSLRQGVRVGLTPATVPEIAKFLGSLDMTTLADAVAAANEGRELTPRQRNAIGRFELAADARIDAAVTVALGRYAGGNRVAASVVALTIAIVAAATIRANDETVVSWAQAAIIGIAAVPLAPIAKDVVSGIQAATRALRARI